MVVLPLLVVAAGLSACGDDDRGARSAAAATPTAQTSASPTPTIRVGDPPATATPIQPCPTAVVVQCTENCSGLGGCCAIAPVGGAYACFDPSVQCATPCTNAPPGWVGSTQCGSAPGDDPSKACIVPPTGTPTRTATATPTPTINQPCTPIVAAASPTRTPVTPTPGGSTPTPIATISCADGNALYFTNTNRYPVWLAEAYQGGGDLDANTILPAGSDWRIEPGATISLCLPAPWSGRFWPRTGCEFDEKYRNDVQNFDTKCSQDGDCNQGRICYGGRCMLDCGSGGTSFCQGSDGLDDANAICVESPYGDMVHFCSFPQNTVCRTGDCQGLYQCYGVWGAHQSRYGASGPVSLFEPTSTSADNVNYDVSLVSGYNTQIGVQPSGAGCYAPRCLADLNQECPANLQVTEAPSATPGPTSMKCSEGVYCAHGACAGNTCVVGCNDPGDQCDVATPPAALMCDEVIPAGDGGDGASTYQDMYNAKGSNGDTMISANQGTPTCWGELDCLPGEVCVTCITDFPAGVGICLPANGDIPQPQISCASQTDVGKACGGYTAGFSGAFGYTCASIGSRDGDVACVPSYNPPVSGTGTLVTSTDGTTKFYSGTGSPLNPAWVAAAKQAGGGTPWYETFSETCPHQYGWQYDDHTGGFACNPADGSSVSFFVTFGPGD